jgi:hypothetical protein
MIFNIEVPNVWIGEDFNSSESESFKSLQLSLFIYQRQIKLRNILEIVK